MGNIEKRAKAYANKKIRVAVFSISLEICQTLFRNNIGDEYLPILFQTIKDIYNQRAKLVLECSVDIQQEGSNKCEIAP